MDRYHDRFPVYDDAGTAGNHFLAYAKIPGPAAPVMITGSSVERPHAGATAIRCEFRPSNSRDFGGYIFQNGVLRSGQSAPEVNFGEVPHAGVDLSGATALTFWARGSTGYESIEFFVGGVGRDPYNGQAVTKFPDSMPRRPRIGTQFRLTTEWQRFSISLSGADLSYVLGGFGWVADTRANPNGAAFYLDDIQFELNEAGTAARLNEPRFLQSFITQPNQPNPFDANTLDDFDLVFRNTAFTYDNALALLAFLADGSDDSLRRARLIGDAFIYAAQHDRTFNDGRLRSAYSAGDIAMPPGWTPNGRSVTVPVATFYSEAKQRTYEVEQDAIDVGNNAWALISLLALYQRTGEPRYLNAARKLGDFIHMFRNDAGAYPGFLGGITQPEAHALPRPYASSEHNLDIAAAFTTLHTITGDERWQTDAQHAKHFVQKMWDALRGCFWTGAATANMRNESPMQLPLDVQAWSVLAMPEVMTLHPNVLNCAQLNHHTLSKGYSGYDFNADKDGVWFEGTAQMAVAYAVAGLTPPYDIRAQLRRAQTTQPFGDAMGIVAATLDGLTTGFDTPGGSSFLYYRRLHVGATAWNVFAQLGVNPYSL